MSSLPLSPQPPCCERSFAVPGGLFSWNNYTAVNRQDSLTAWGCRHTWLSNSCGYWWHSDMSNKMMLMAFIDNWQCHIRQCSDFLHEQLMMIYHNPAGVECCDELEALCTATLRLSTNRDGNHVSARKDLVPHYLMKTLICPLAAGRFCRPQGTYYLLGHFSTALSKIPN